MAFLFGFGLSMGVAYLSHRVRTRRRASAAAHAAQADSPPLAESPGPGAVLPGLDHGPPRTVPARPDATPPPGLPDPLPVRTLERRPDPVSQRRGTTDGPAASDAGPAPSTEAGCRERRCSTVDAGATRPRKKVVDNNAAVPPMRSTPARGHEGAGDTAHHTTPDEQPPAPARVMVPDLVDPDAKPPIVRAPVKKVRARKR